MLAIFKNSKKEIKDENVIEVQARDVLPRQKVERDDSTVPFVIMLIGTMGVIGAIAGMRVANIKANKLPMSTYNLLKTYKCLPGHFEEQYLNELGDDACIKHSKIVNIDTAQRYAIAEANAYKKMVSEQKRVYLADANITKAKAVFDLNNGASLRQGVDVTFNTHFSNITENVIPSANAQSDPDITKRDNETKNRFDNIKKPPKNLNYPFLF